LLKVHQDFNELTHDVREARDTTKQDECGDDSFDLTLWMVVTKTHRGEGRECEVHNDGQLSEVRLLTELVDVVESSLVGVVLVLSEKLADEKPERSEEVGQNQNDDDQTQHSEDVHDLDLQQNHVVVDVLVRVHLLILNDLLQAGFKKALDEVLEVLGLKKTHHLTEAEHLQQE
jgi:hypothetical protein